MPFSFIFLNDCKRMPANAKLKVLISNQINSAGLKYFNTEAEQKVFCNLLKTSLVIKGNLNNPVFLPFTLPFSSSVNDAAILK